MLATLSPSWMTAVVGLLEEGLVRGERGFFREKGWWRVGGFVGGEGGVGGLLEGKGGGGLVGEGG